MRSNTWNLQFAKIDVVSEKLLEHFQTPNNTILLGEKITGQHTGIKSGDQGT